METKVIKIDPKEIKLLEVNARYMKADEFNRLVENIKRDGALSSVPFCSHTDEWENASDDDWPEYEWEVLSGNHRVQAAIEAGLEEISIMVTEEKLTNEQKVAIALSHNSITGQDDMAILKQMYESINDIDLKGYSGLDDETLQMLDKVGSQSMSAIGLDYQILNIVVLPTELKMAKEIIDKARKQVEKNTALTLRYEDYDKWLDTMDDVSAAVGVKNTATVLLSMLEVVSNHMEDLREVWVNEEDNDKQWVPISTLTNRTKIRAKDGKVVEKAIQRMIDKGDIKKGNRDEALAIMAEAYLEQSKNNSRKKDKK